MEDEELLQALEGLVILTPEEQAAEPVRPMSKTARKKLWRDQAPDPNSNTSKKKERKRLENRTPAQVRREEIVAERARLRELAQRANIGQLTERLDHSPEYKDERRVYARKKAIEQKRKRRSGN